MIDFITQIFSIPIRKEAAEHLSHNPGFSRHLPDIVPPVRGGSEKEPLIHIEIQTDHDEMMDFRRVKHGYLPVNEIFGVTTLNWDIQTKRCRPFLWKSEYFLCEIKIEQFIF